MFLDTNGWIALLNSNDRWHAREVEESGRMRTARCPLVTTDWVLAETGNGLAKTAARLRFAGAVERFLGSSNCRLVRMDQELFREALDLYNRAADKSWGLIDCASFAVMRHENICDALTSDRHFQQAGFRPLVAAPPR